MLVRLGLVCALGVSVLTMSRLGLAQTNVGAESAPVRAVDIVVVGSEADVEAVRSTTCRQCLRRSHGALVARDELRDGQRVRASRRAERTRSARLDRPQRRRESIVLLRRSRGRALSRAQHGAARRAHTARARSNRSSARALRARPARRRACRHVPRGNRRALGARSPSAGKPIATATGRARQRRKPRPPSRAERHSGPKLSTARGSFRAKYRSFMDLASDSRGSPKARNDARPSG